MPCGVSQSHPIAPNSLPVVELGLVLVAFVIPGVYEKMRAILVRTLIGRLGFIIDIDTFAESCLNLSRQSRCKFVNTPSAAIKKLRQCPIGCRLYAILINLCHRSTMRGIYQTRDESAKMVEVFILEEVLII